MAASVGSYGAALADGSAFRGDYRVSESALAKFHRPRLEALNAQAPDVIACETLPTVVEATVLARSLEPFPGTRAWLSFTARDQAHTAAGEPIERCAGLANSSSAIVAVGVNCVAPALVEPLLHRLHAVTDKPLVAYPNGGEVWHAVRRGWVMGEGEAGSLATMAPAWIAAGARLLGGCCRTTPAQMAGLAEVIREWPRPPA